MFDIGAGELLVIGIVALVVIGPKELPGVLRQVGKFSGKMRQMAGEFRSQFDEAMREAELEDTRKQLTGLKDDLVAKSGLSEFKNLGSELSGLNNSIIAPVSTTSAAKPAVLPEPVVPEPVVAVDTQAATVPAKRTRRTVLNAVAPDDKVAEVASAGSAMPTKRIAKRSSAKTEMAETGTAAKIAAGAGRKPAAAFKAAEPKVETAKVKTAKDKTV
jgi:sec-independent protein translocase protein TatB